MKLITIIEANKLGKPLASEISDKYVNLYRAQPLKYLELRPDSYATRSLKFAKEHAVSMANTEEEPYHVVKVMVKTSDVYNAYNPGEYIYNGPILKGKSIFIANVGDDFPE